MAIQVIQKENWYYIPAPGRLDAFNFETTKTELENVAKEAKQIALDVSGVQFVSIPMIKFIHSLASELVRKGGRFALVGPSEKIKRQIHIFASVDTLTFYTPDNWDRLVNTSAKGRA